MQFLSNLLDSPFIDLNSLDCPTILTKNFKYNCQNHTFGEEKFSKHCARAEACFYFDWLTNESEDLTKVEVPLLPSSTICALTTQDGILNLSISKDETIKTGNQFLQRKIKLLLTEEEVHTFTLLIYYIEHFLQWKKQNLRGSSQTIPPEVASDALTPNW